MTLTFSRPISTSHSVGYNAARLSRGTNDIQINISVNNCHYGVISKVSVNVYFSVFSLSYNETNCAVISGVKTRTNSPSVKISKPL